MINTDKNVERSYIVLRNHEGNVDILDSKYNADTHMITFQTNLFSDYAIAYKDVTKTNNQSAISNTGNKVNRSAKTGDTADVAGYGIVLLLSLIAAGAAFFLKKEEQK